LPTFHYKASTLTGKIVEDNIVSEDKGKAIQELQKLSLIVLNINEERKTWFKKFFHFDVKVAMLEKVIFFKHLSSMLDAGLTISESIETLSDQTENKNFSKILKEAHANLKSGLSLFATFACYPSVFSTMALSMIRIGESSGTLSDSLTYLTRQMEKTYETRKKLIGAFIYPAILLSMTVLLILFLMTFTMPKIMDILSTFDTKLPRSTQIVMNISEFIRAHYLLIIIGVFGLITGFRISIKTKTIRPIIHLLYLKLPIFGNLLKKTNISLFSRTFSSLIQSGTPIVEAINITADTLSNYQYQKVIREAGEKIQQGGSLSEALGSHKKLFPPMVSKMIAVGEQIGNLSKTSSHLAKLYEKEVSQATKNLSTLLEPILLLIMGVSVGGLAVAIIAPIYEISSSALG